MIKEFILGVGEKLINVLAVLSVVGVFLAGIAASSETRSFGEGLLVFLLVEIIGIAWVVATFFFLYLWLDIRDILKDIRNSNNKTKTE
jgi:hypothetical protein